MSRRRLLHTRMMNQRIRKGKFKEGSSLEQFRAFSNIQTKGKRVDRQTKSGEFGVRQGYRANLRWRRDNWIGRAIFQG